MKSRMDRYQDSTSTLQRTSKNDSLYEELYKEKPGLRSNVTVLDNVNEIDINKIKEMVNSREGYRKNRSYEDIKNPTIYKEKEIDYHFDEIDDKDYDINEIMEKKRTDRMYSTDEKVRKLSSREYEELKELIVKDELVKSKLDDDDLTREEQISEIINTLVQKEEVTDFFANLKEEPKKVTEETFYTNTNKFEMEDFKDEIESKKGSKIFVIITVIALLIATGVFIWFKFIK